MEPYGPPIDSVAAKIDRKQSQINDVQKHIQQVKDDIRLAVEAAQGAVDDITNTDWRTLRGYSKPPPQLLSIMQCVLCLAGQTDADWAKIKAFVARKGAQGMKNFLLSYDITELQLDQSAAIHSSIPKHLEELHERPAPTGDIAAKLTQWVRAQYTKLQKAGEVREYKHQVEHWQFILKRLTDQLKEEMGIPTDPAVEVERAPQEDLQASCGVGLLATTEYTFQQVIQNGSTPRVAPTTADTSEPFAEGAVAASTPGYKALSSVTLQQPTAHPSAGSAPLRGEDQGADIEFFAQLDDIRIQYARDVTKEEASRFVHQIRSCEHEDVVLQTQAFRTMLAKTQQLVERYKVRAKLIAPSSRDKHIASERVRSSSTTDMLKAKAVNVLASNRFQSKDSTPTTVRRSSVGAKERNRQSSDINGTAWNSPNTHIPKTSPATVTTVLRDDQRSKATRSERSSAMKRSNSNPGREPQTVYKHLPKSPIPSGGCKGKASSNINNNNNDHSTAGTANSTPKFCLFGMKHSGSSSTPNTPSAGGGIQRCKTPPPPPSSKSRFCNKTPSSHRSATVTNVSVPNKKVNPDDTTKDKEQPHIESGPSTPSRGQGGCRSESPFSTASNSSSLGTFISNIHKTPPIANHQGSGTTNANGRKENNKNVDTEMSPSLGPHEHPHQTQPIQHFPPPLIPHSGVPAAVTAGESNPQQSQQQGPKRSASTSNGVFTSVPCPSSPPPRKSVGSATVVANNSLSPVSVSEGAIGVVVEGDTTTLLGGINSAPTTPGALSECSTRGASTPTTDISGHTYTPQQQQQQSGEGHVSTPTAYNTPGSHITQLPPVTPTLIAPTATTSTVGPCTNTNNSTSTANQLPSTPTGSRAPTPPPPVPPPPGQSGQGTPRWSSTQQSVVGGTTATAGVAGGGASVSTADMVVGPHNHPFAAVVGANHMHNNTSNSNGSTNKEFALRSNTAYGSIPRQHVTPTDGTGMMQQQPQQQLSMYGPFPPYLQPPTLDGGNQQEAYRMNMYNQQQQEQRRQQSSISPRSSPLPGRPTQSPAPSIMSQPGTNNNSLVTPSPPYHGHTPTYPHHQFYNNNWAAGMGW